MCVQYSNTMANEGEQEYQRVASKNDLQEGNLLKVEVRGKELVLSMVDGKIFAMENECTHQGGPLNEGELKGYGLLYLTSEMEKFPTAPSGQAI